MNRTLADTLLHGAGYVDPTPPARGGYVGSTDDWQSLPHYFDPQEPIGHVAGGNLPHWRQDGATYFVTFRTVDSMPRERVEQWKRERDEWLQTHPEPRYEAMRQEYRRLFRDQVIAKIPN